MLQKLSIRNFRIFEELDIEGLKRVNLIVGKNNTGKTTLLEAIRILEAKGHSTVINNILKNRGQFTPSWDESYDTLFSKISTQSEAKLTINALEVKKFSRLNRFGYAVNSELQLSSSDSPDNPNDQVIYLPLYTQINPLQNLWDRISLTSLEDDVIHILRQTIEPQINRIDVSSGGEVRIRLDNEKKPLHVNVLGDGVKRVLLIALAIVNAKHELDGREGKIILIDELESGLHHSVQEKLWNLIFEYAKKWQIQFFITTHNQDTLNTFYYVANEVQNQDEAFLFRLQYSRTGKLEVIPYDVDRLENVLEMNIDIR
jgi:AAA15 family ATPase/GTPase